jgi:hypothetical protein
LSFVLQRAMNVQASAHHPALVLVNSVLQTASQAYTARARR